ncbi:hypothetical protein RJT34_08719 [Clitoria ternatea]|uniref:Uncharacterized protein n=1 Tax=Clitoria ternatea TaxID=43366 RepID=A0AAN9K4W0_CLITE
MQYRWSLCLLMVSFCIFFTLGGTGLLICIHYQWSCWEMLTHTAGFYIAEDSGVRKTAQFKLHAIGDEINCYLYRHCFHCPQRVQIMETAIGETNAARIIKDRIFIKIAGIESTKSQGKDNGWERKCHNAEDGFLKNHV